MIRSPVGLPARVIKNEFYWRLEQGEKIDFECPYKCLKTCEKNKVNYCIAQSLLKAQKGDMRNGLVLCSLTTPLITEIVSVKDLMTILFSNS